MQERIREKQNELRFVNIFGNLCRQQLLATQIRRICSSVRNSYQELVSQIQLLIEMHGITDTLKAL